MPSITISLEMQKTHNDLEHKRYLKAKDLNIFDRIVNIRKTTTILNKSTQVERLKRQTIIAADDILIFYFDLLKKIRLDFPCESSA